MAIPQWLKGRPIAHRGLHDDDAGQRPENSLASFEAAVAQGYGIELDVRLSRDGVPMVFHDGSLSRMCGRGGSVEEIDAAELQKIALKGSLQRIPTLAETLRVVDGRVPILVELKSGLLGMPGAFERAVNGRISNYSGPLAVIAFNPLSLVWFQINAPHILRGQLSSSPLTLVWSLRCAMRALKGERLRRSSIPDVLTFIKQKGIRPLLWVHCGGPHFIATWVDDLPDLFSLYLRLTGTPVLAWTIRDTESAANAFRHASNFIFETPFHPT